MLGRRVPGRVGGQLSTWRGWWWSIWGPARGGISGRSKIRQSICGRLIIGIGVISSVVELLDALAGALLVALGL